MQAIRDFIVKTDVVFNDTFKLESGLELHGDKRFLQKRLSQREVLINAIPLNYKGEDITGWQAFIDPTIYYQNLYDHGKGDNNEIDGYEGCFKVQPNMILAIRKKSTDEWIGFDENLVVERVMDVNEEKKSGLIILEIAKPKAIPGLAKITISNEELLEQDFCVGDSIRFDNTYGVDVYIDGKEYVWLKNRYVYAKIEDDGNKEK